MKLLFWLVVLVVAVIMALFAVDNRETVAVALWPLPFMMQMPLYLAFLGSLVVGMGVGAIAAWSGGHGRRREARRRARRIEALERELADTQAQLPGASAAEPPALALRG